MVDEPHLGKKQRAMIHRKSGIVRMFGTYNKPKPNMGTYYQQFRMMGSLHQWWVWND